MKVCHRDRSKSTLVTLNATVSEKVVSIKLEGRGIEQSERLTSRNEEKPHSQLLVVVEDICTK